MSQYVSPGRRDVCWLMDHLLGSFAFLQEIELDKQQQIPRLCGEVKYMLFLI